MMVTDPIADMLTRIRNAQTAKHDTVDIPGSKVKTAIANILLDEGYVETVEFVEEGINGIIRITLKYGVKKNAVITGIRRISKPGLRVYAKCENLPKVLGGLGIAIISTSKGIMTDKNARAIKHGGEVLAYVW
ncbi:MAG: 30S ribosomal protein S8 [Clostridia bacterium]